MTLPISKGKRTMKTKILAFFALTLMGCSDPESPVKLELYNKQNPLWNFPYLSAKVISVSDKVTIKDITINKGNCNLLNSKHKERMPAQIAFGQSFELAFENCDVIEVGVSTDKGDWYFSY